MVLRCNVMVAKCHSKAGQRRKRAGKVSSTKENILKLISLTGNQSVT